MTESTLESSVDGGDPGDETLKRYRYQFTLAAICAVDLIGEEPEFSAVYCEHWEDILVRKSCGSFIAVQVKTRDDGLGPFKSTDKDIVKSLARFALLEARFGSQITRYSIATNCGFYRASRAGTNLPHVISLALECPEPPASGPVKNLISRIKTVASKREKDTMVTDGQILAVLNRTKLERPIAIDAVRSVLISRLSKSCAELYDASIPTLEKVAEDLIGLACRASSKSHEDEFAQFMTSADQEEANAILAKQLSAELVLEAVTTHRIERNLRSNGPILLPSSHSTLERKLTLGGLSAATVSAAIDWKASTIYLERQWAQKYGEREACSRYEQLQTVAKTVAAFARESSQTSSAPFGKTMLLELESRVAQRLNEPSSLSPDCQQEHLLGTVAHLTEQCEIWWSEEVSLEDEVL